MDTNLIIGATAALGGTGLILGLGLSFASKKFHVEIDEKIEQILDAMPGSNCGACGYIGCEDAAAKIAFGEANANTCIAGGSNVAEKIASIMGVEAGEVQENIAVLQCQGGRKSVKQRYDYALFDDCAAAHMVAGGPSMCGYGCLGFGTCIKSCPFDAMMMGADDLPKIDPEKCTGCGLCNQACPRKILPLLDKETPVFVACNSLDKGKDIRSYCKVGCIACKICEKENSDVFKVEDNLAVVDFEKSSNSNCDTCIEKCPTKCIVANKASTLAKQS